MLTHAFIKKVEKVMTVLYVFITIKTNTVKTLDFNNSINITGGLPFIRVSPDHGPAFDIAKKIIANTESIIAAFNFLKEVVK